MTRAELRGEIILHNSPGFRGKSGRVAADLVNYAACQFGREERRISREITNIVVMDCYDEIVVYIVLRGGEYHGGETCEAHYWRRDLYGGEVRARPDSPPPGR